MKRTLDSTMEGGEQKVELEMAAKFKIISVLDEGTDIRMAVSILGDCWVLAWMYHDNTSCQGPVYLFPTASRHANFKLRFTAIQADFRNVNPTTPNFLDLDDGQTWSSICGWFAEKDRRLEPLPDSINIQPYREQIQEKFIDYYETH